MLVPLPLSSVTDEQESGIDLFSYLVIFMILRVTRVISSQAIRITHIYDYSIASLSCRTSCNTDEHLR